MTSGNPILDKNLESIEKYNPELKEKLLNLPYLTNDIQLIETNLQEPNLSYNGLPLHSQEGAEVEAKALFDKAGDTDLQAHFILGIGLGHVFKEFCERAKGKVILYESNLDILRVTLELVDFSKELSQGNVRIASDYSEVKTLFRSVYEYKMSVGFAILDSYRAIYGGEAQKILDQIDFAHRGAFSDYSLVNSVGVDHLLTIFENLQSSVEGIPVGAIADTYKGKTAIIVSAGPTLDQNVEAIKKNRDKAIIFCVGTAFKTLMKYGITPDFINVLEMFDCSGQLKGFDLSDINIIMEPCSHPSFYALKTKQKFIYPSSAAQWGKYWSQIVGIDAAPYLSCGTVSYQALQSAKMLGFETIIMVGQDLAFVNNSCYSKDSAYSDLIFEMNPLTGKPEYKIKDYEHYVSSLIPAGTDTAEQWCRDLADSMVQSLNDSLIFIKGITGEMLPTARGYAMFVDGFVNFAKDNKDLKLINTSLIGVQIDGFENIPLEKALENMPSVERVQIDSSFKLDKKYVLEKLETHKKILQSIMAGIRKAEGLIYKYEREVKIRKVITEDAGKYCKQFMGIFRQLYAEFFQSNIIFNLISFHENVELIYVIKSSDEPDTDKNITIWYKALKEYYEKVGEKVERVLDKIETNIELFSKSETCSPASK